MKLSTILETIPSGSGINGDWKIEESQEEYKLVNYYQPMNEVGMYDGVAFFTLTIPKASPIDFTLSFNSSYDKAKAEEYQLEEYLVEVFADWIREEWKKEEEEFKWIKLSIHDFDVRGSILQCTMCGYPFDDEDTIYSMEEVLACSNKCRSDYHAMLRDEEEVG